MATDPEQLPDAPPPRSQQLSHALLFSNNASYSSPYSSNTTSYRSPYSSNHSILRAPDNSQHDVLQPHYRQLGFQEQWPPSYPSLNPQNPTSQSSRQYRTPPPPARQTLLGQLAPPNVEYRSPYGSSFAVPPEPSRTSRNLDVLSPIQYSTVLGNGYQNEQMGQQYTSPFLLPESSRMPPNVDTTSPSQFKTVPENGYQNHQMVQQAGFTMPSRDAPSAELSPDESRAPRLAMGRFSRNTDDNFQPRETDQALDNLIDGILKEQVFIGGLDNEMAVDQEHGYDPDEPESSEEQEEDDEDENAYEYDEVEESGDESDFLQDSDNLSRDGEELDDGELSDTDTVTREHNERMKVYRRDRLEVKLMHKDPKSRSKYKRMATAKLRKGPPRGPRKIAELTGDIRMKLGRANQFYFLQNYEEARKEAQEIIRINAEVWQAWSLLALIFKEWGEFDEEMLAMTSSCHFMPKEESGMAWLTLARRINEADDESRQKHLADGVYCCSAALKTLKHNVEALCLKGSFNREMSRIKSAIGEYESALREDPHNSTAMRGLALCYLDEDRPELAQKIYEETIAFYQESGLPENGFGWNEIAIYIELHGSIGQYAEAIRHLKFLSRWILGRGEESYWDEVTVDDREWDTNDLRRSEVPSYRPDTHDTLTYGDGLPLELRTKLGLYRLKLGNFQEAMIHFSFLESEGQFSDEEGVAALADLFHEVGDSLYEAGHHEDALAFYKILKDRVPNDEDFSHYLHMGKCYFQIEDLAQAEEAFLIALDHDENNVTVRQELVKLYDSIEDNTEATKYRQEIKDLIKKSNKKSKLTKVQPEKAPKAFIERKEPKAYRGRKKDITTNANAIHERQIEEARIADLLQSYEIIQQCNEGLKAGDVEATSLWMAAAADLVADFRTCKGLYPYDKYYYAQSRIDKEKAMQNENKKAALDDDIGQEDNLPRPNEQRRRPQMPTEHLCIPWATWLDILVQYALCLSKEQKYLDAYDVCISAKEAVIYCHDQEAMFTIYLCWCTCAVLANDMDTITSQMRHFMKEYQFTTDAYRLFATLVRLCQSPLSHLTKGPTTKFILRNIKTMDFSLLGDIRGHEEFSGRTSYSARDANGKIVVNTEMDICLLLLYGHILYVNTSFGKALHYLFRAHSLDPTNATINMSVGLCYIQYAIKRQTGYRPYVILQGISFMLKYYENRKDAETLEEREEAHFNMARSYHMLGLNHLAIPFYLRVLREAELGSGSGGGREDLVVDAAYNLQTLYAVAGNVRLAKAVTDRWLVV